MDRWVLRTPRPPFTPTPGWVRLGAASPLLIKPHGKASCHTLLLASLARPDPHPKNGQARSDSFKKKKPTPPGSSAAGARADSPLAVATERGGGAGGDGGAEADATIDAASGEMVSLEALRAEVVKSAATRRHSAARDAIYGKEA